MRYTYIDFQVLLKVDWSFKIKGVWRFYKLLGEDNSSFCPWYWSNSMSLTEYFFLLAVKWQVLCDNFNFLSSDAGWCISVVYSIAKLKKMKWDLYLFWKGNCHSKIASMGGCKLWQQLKFMILLLFMTYPLPNNIFNWILLSKHEQVMVFFSLSVSTNFTCAPEHQTFLADNLLCHRTASQKWLEMSPRGNGWAPEV